jgi:hypothetical protein
MVLLMVLVAAIVVQQQATQPAFLKVSSLNSNLSSVSLLLLLKEQGKELMTRYCRTYSRLYRSRILVLKTQKGNQRSFRLRYRIRLVSYHGIGLLGLEERQCSNKWRRLVRFFLYILYITMAVCCNDTILCIKYSSIIDHSGLLAKLDKLGALPRFIRSKRLGEPRTNME